MVDPCGGKWGMNKKKLPRIETACFKNILATYAFNMRDLSG